MRRWTAVAIFITLIVALVGGYLVEPSDSQSNLETATWLATYYSNVQLEGEPTLQRYERALSYNWSQDAPIGVPPDQFSARWIGRFDFEAGLWRFLVGADDGIRLWVDDVLIIDQWEPVNQFVNYSSDIELEEGEHTVQVEYYDNTGLAGINVRWQPMPEQVVVGGNDPTPPPDNNSPGPEGTTPESASVGLVATSELNVYQGPGIQYLRIGQVYLYQRFGIAGQNANATWYLLNLGEGRVGWVSSDFIVLVESTEIPVVYRVTTDNFSGVTGETSRGTKLHTAPDPSSEALELIPIRTQLTVLGRSGNSYWYKVRYNDVEGWVFGPAIQIVDALPADLPFVQ